MRASGVDLCAASTHKWMMGDKGLGFLYVRRDLLDGGRIRGTEHGWKQIASGDFKIFPDAPSAVRGPGYRTRPGAVGQFEVGTYALGPLHCARASLAYVERLGVPAIRAHAAALVSNLREALPRVGYPCLSPPRRTSRRSASPTGRPPRPECARPG